MDPRRLVLFLVFTGSFLTTLNIASVNVALPSLVDELDAGLDGGKLVVVGYVATVTVLLIPLGRLGDMLGRRRFYAAGFLLFGTGATLCSIATDLPQLIGFRMMQALGAGMIIAQGSAIIASVFGPGERGSALGWQVVAVATGSTSGMVLGGLLTDLLGWRSVFWTNAPVALLGFVLALVVLPRGLRGQGQFDTRGATWLTLAIVALLLAANVATPAAPDRALPGLAAAALLIVALVLHQRRATAPLLAPELRSSRPFLLGVFAALFGFTATISATFLMPFFLQDALGLAPGVMGLVMLSYPFAVVVASPLAGRLSDRVGARVPATAGLVVVALALLALGSLGGGVEVWQVSLLVGVLGLGLGTFASPNNNAVFAAVPKEHLGVANGMLGTMRNLGVAMGATLTSLLFLTFAPGNVVPAGDPAAFTDAMRPALWFAASLALLAAALSARRPRARSDEAAQAPAAA